MTGSQPDDKRIGRYTVVRELGRGGMGIVYEAVDPAIGRKVAIKVINLQFLTGAGEAQLLRERLFREARSAGALSHPGIVVVYDVGEDREMAFIAMEYVDGPSLQQAQSGGKLQPADVVEILRQVAAALDYAHRNGVVHRDIKPPNIMLHQGTQVKIADFGIAKITNAPKYTVTGLVMGTPAYMSPEQIEGREVDGRSDQFSLAVVAYELLTGSVPFQGKTYVSMIHSIVYGERPSARAANPDLPAAFDDVLKRGMAPVSQDRFPTCSEFVSALNAALSAPAPQPVVTQAATLAPPVVLASAAPTIVIPARANRRTMPLAAVLLLLALALGSAAAYRFWPMLQNRAERPAQSVQTSPPVQPPAQATPPEEKQKAGEAPPPIVADARPKPVAPTETAAAPVKKKPEVIAEAPPAAPIQIEKQPAENTPEPTTIKTVIVSSDQPWTLAGILLRVGDKASVAASGAIRVVAEDKRLALQQPGGFSPNCNRVTELFHIQIGAVPAPAFSCWSLIGRVGLRGPVFEIGVQGDVPAGSVGRLFLGVNDDNYSDNAGSWSAVVTVKHQ